MNSGDDHLELLSALDVLRAAAPMDPDGQERWRVVADFHGRADRAAFGAACAAARSGNGRERMIGLDVLGQFGHGADRPFLEETLPLVAGACADRHPGVAGSALVALGHLADPRGLPAVLGQAGHADEDVRQAVAFTLPSVAGEPARPEAVTALILLSTDSSDQVRDWATFGLGLESTGDTEQIRRALLDRVTDPDPDTAGEAFLGLARRGDRRILAALGAALDAPAPADILLQAACEAATPELLPALHRLRQRDALQPQRVDEAVTACSTPRPAPPTP
ncbi:HEAT repeat domain-containing protein [Streptomyces sp. NPDC059247]|uniref:HEAT repeat domain-containing protein n=1 Tax=Streptomyces sp. NPDC059247 TaxID=3346790 RepID=UPI00369D2372